MRSIRQAFSAIELVFIVAVIAIFTAMLKPAIEKACENAAKHANADTHAVVSR